MNYYLSRNFMLFRNVKTEIKVLGSLKANFGSYILNSRLAEVDPMLFHRVPVSELTGI